VAPISIRGLTKRYGNVPAVSHLSLEVFQGEILGFLGLNGAGKTTTIRILLDLLRPNSGNAFLLGHDCQTDGLRARLNIGYLPAEMGIYSDLTGHEVLGLLAGLSGHVIDKRRRGELQERLEFPDSDLRRRLREYSTGMKRKLGLIQAFQSDPQLLILDEPTEGLDPLMQESFYKLLVDVEELRKLAARPVRVLFAEDVPAAANLPSGSELMETNPRAWSLNVEGPLGPLLRALAPLPVRDIEIAEAKLEEVILKYYRDGAGDSNPGGSNQ
jgi:ABC-2 type transport system ATP-binding protein